MKYLFIRIDGDNFTTKESEDLKDFIDFNEYLTEKDFSKLESDIKFEMKCNNCFYRLNNHDVKYAIAWNIEHNKLENPAKEIVDYNGAYCGYDVVLYKNIDPDDEDWEDKINEYSNDARFCLTTPEYFASVDDAFFYMERTLLGDNDFTYGMICHYAYEIDYEEDPKYGFGKCLTYEYVGDLWAEKI